MLTGDRLPRQQRGAPAETGRERDLCAAHLHQRIHDELVKRAAEIASAVQQPFCHGQRLLQLGFEGRAHFVDQGLHLAVCGQKVGKHRQQAVIHAAHLAALHINI